MAQLITANAANELGPDDPVDLLGVGFVHGSAFVAYMEADEDDTLEDLSLEAEGLVPAWFGGCCCWS